MFLVGLLRWWYGSGLEAQFIRVGAQLSTIAQFFSIGQLLKTFFSPFRQISAGATGGPIGVQARAFLDRLISRCVGAVIRFLTIIAGLVTLTLASVYLGVMAVVWLVVPILPVAGAVLFAVGLTL